MKKIEILAPAGSYESLTAAINASCDAVYIGGSRFGARAYADNLTEDDMLRAIDYTHIHDKKIYLTVNTLLKNKEIKHEIYDYLEKFYERGLDALIVQDLGVLSFIHRNFPDIPIHASTQMTLTMSKGLKFLKQYGVTRIVTSRELSLEEIKAIHEETDLEIESFVHGALCYCYSGQCLMSSMLGGRSGNRGRCAQPCRMPYQLLNDGKIVSNEREQYLLSPKDICTLEMIPDLIEAGIYSFKIEGRMKRPEYAALTASLYRKYVDLYLELGKEGYNTYMNKNQKELDKDVRHLSDLYNRGDFTKGYYSLQNGKSMMSMNRPNHSGVLVGKVVGIKGIRAKIQLSTDVHAQDILEFRNYTGENKYDFTVKEDNKKGNTIETNFKSGSGIQIEDLVYRTKNQNLLNEVGNSFLKDETKVPITGIFTAHIGEPVKLLLKCRDIEITVTGDTVDKAEKQPVSEEKIMTQLKKTNTTSFIFHNLELDMDSNIFIPVGKLNEFRRDAMELLAQKIVKQEERKSSGKNELRYIDIPKKDQTDQKIGICASVGNFIQLRTALQYKEIDSIYLRMEDLDFNQINQAIDEISDNNISFYLVMPTIFRKNAYDLLEKALIHKNIILEDSRITGFVIKNLEEYEFLLSHIDISACNKSIIFDYNLYTMNQEAQEFWRKHGVSHFTSPVELNEQELKELGCEDSDLLVYGHISLMTSAQCIIKNTAGCTKITKNNKLRDRYNKEFIVINHCKYCYNTIYNSIPLSLLNLSDEINCLSPKQIRLDFTVESEENMRIVLKKYINVFRYNKKENSDFLKEYTKGHFKRGIE